MAKNNSWFSESDMDEDDFISDVISVFVEAGFSILGVIFGGDNDEE